MDTYKLVAVIQRIVALAVVILVIASVPVWIYRSQPHPVGIGVVSYDYPDFLHIQGKHYERDTVVPVLDPKQIGRRIGKVLRRVTWTPADQPHYRERDGDAHDLPVGTPIYAMTSTSIAVYFMKVYLLYATKGALLNKVSSQLGWRA
jgi:hypothetical protein